MATAQITAGAAVGTVSANILAPIVLYYTQVRGFTPPMEFDTAFAVGSVLAVVLTTLGTWIGLLARAWFLRHFGKEALDDPSNTAGS